MPAQHVEGGQPKAAIPNQTELLTQILSGIQNMNTRIDRVDQRMDRIEDTMNDIRRHQGHDCVIIMLLSLLFLFLIFILNINELLLLFNIKVLCYFSCYLFT